MVSRSPGPSKRKAPTELDSAGTRQDGCQAGGQNYRILRSYRRLGGRLAGSGYGGLCLLESAESSPPSKAQGAMTESRRGPLLASERTPRKAPASWTLVAAEPALRGGSGAVTNCCYAAKPLSPIRQKRPEQGYLTISNALQWRLQYGRVIEKAGAVKGVHSIYKGEVE